jgi:hypothetical protein
MDNALPQQAKVPSAVPPKRYLAHVRQDDHGSFVIHDLEEHHLGKYSATFQHYSTSPRSQPDRGWKTEV